MPSTSALTNSTNSYHASAASTIAAEPAINLKRESFSESLRAAFELSSISTANTTGNLVTASMSQGNMAAEAATKSPTKNVEIVAENHARNTGAGTTGSPGTMNLAA